jgi:hypothetical protein
MTVPSASVIDDAQVGGHLAQRITDQRDLLVGERRLPRADVASEPLGSDRQLQSVVNRIQFADDPQAFQIGNRPDCSTNLRLLAVTKLHAGSESD